MGSGYDLTDTEKMGVIPRVVKGLFRGVKERSETADFILKCSLLEVTTHFLYIVYIVYTYSKLGLAFASKRAQRTRIVGYFRVSYIQQI
ncbi:hypothetical protein HOLleu_30282 [Holothuria leucospilota]|uniref:Kinesin motor domain-containing protein n=1 Tax=Holothuria leucospilota TaxID=206669 RepID=A0A9Q1BK49_HOLLE|nr:hypothetical protein HOLleu_30282 [Holothuria leucospilota]